MSKDSISNRQLYDAILDTRESLHKRINEVVDTRITPLEVWKANLMGKLAVIVGIAILGINFIIEWVKEKFFKV